MRQIFELTDELVDALYDGETIATESWRWGHTDTLVFCWLGRPWKTTIQVHHSEGWQLGNSIEAVPVKQVEVTKLVWVEDKSNPSETGVTSDKGAT